MWCFGGGGHFWEWRGEWQVWLFWGWWPGDEEQGERNLWFEKTILETCAEERRELRAKMTMPRTSSLLSLAEYCSFFPLVFFFFHGQFKPLCQCKSRPFLLLFPSLFWVASTLGNSAARIWISMWPGKNSCIPFVQNRCRIQFHECIFAIGCLERCVRREHDSRGTEKVSGGCKMSCVVLKSRLNHLRGSWVVSRSHSWGYCLKDLKIMMQVECAKSRGAGQDFYYATSLSSVEKRTLVPLNW